MGASSSRIWNDICAMESDAARASMIEAVLSSPTQYTIAKQAGIADNLYYWLKAYRQGTPQPFPYAVPTYGGGRYREDTIQHDTPQWSAAGDTAANPRWNMYTTPIGGGVRQPQYQQTPPQHQQTYPSIRGSELIVSPAAKAMDYFQESLSLLGIDESEELTYDRLRSAYKSAAVAAHPDKGGTAEAFNELRKAYQYIERILKRINPAMSAADKQRMTTVVSPETARAYRTANAPPAMEDTPPVALSAKKLDMSMFNKLFEENRLPDPERDSGYGDWLQSQDGGDAPAADPRLKGKFNQTVFESVFRERALAQGKSSALIKRLEPDAIISHGGVELGSAADNFTAAFGADTQFTDLKQAYTDGSTMFQEVADIKVSERSAKSVSEAKAMRERDMGRVDPDEKHRLAAAAAAFEERERQRRLRLAKQEEVAESWASAMKRRLLVNQ